MSIYGNPVMLGGSGGGGSIQPLVVLQNGIYTASGSIAGYSPVCVLVNVLSVKYLSIIGQYTFPDDGVYAICAVIDGTSASEISYSLSGATLIKEKSQQAVQSTWAGWCLGVVCSAQAGDSITVSGTGVNRSVMTVVALSSIATDISDITMSVGKDSAVTLQKTITDSYVFCASGTTGDDSIPSSSITVTGLSTELYNQTRTPVKSHTCGIYSGSGDITGSAQGTSYATNYVMMFEFSLVPTIS